MSSLVEKVKSLKDWLFGLLDTWRGPIVLAAVVVVLALLIFGYADNIIKWLTESKESAERIAVAIVLVFLVFGLGLVVTFF